MQRARPAENRTGSIYVYSLDDPLDPQMLAVHQRENIWKPNLAFIDAVDTTANVTRALLAGEFNSLELLLLNASAPEGERLRQEPLRAYPSWNACNITTEMCDIVYGMAVLHDFDQRGGAHVVLGGANGIEVLRANFSSSSASDIAASMSRVHFRTGPTGRRFVTALDFEIDVEQATTTTPAPTTSATTVISTSGIAGTGTSTGIGTVTETDTEGTTASTLSATTDSATSTDDETFAPSDELSSVGEMDEPASIPAVGTATTLVPTLFAALLPTIVF